MFEIDKQFDFCYGHRVHNQELNADLSENGICKCRHLHGHNGLLKVGLKAKNLERGMVTDFKNLECIKTLVDDILDHKFIVDIHDPLFKEITAGYSRPVEFSDIHWDAYGLGVIKPEYVEDSVSVANHSKGEEYARAVRDKLEGFVIVDFVPTSENLCKKFAEIAHQRLFELFDGRVQVAYVDFWETPKSHCRYTLD